MSNYPNLAIENRLSNPAYTQLIVQLELARRYLENAESIANELLRDGMLTREDYNPYGMATRVEDITDLATRVREKALS